MDDDMEFLVVLLLVGAVIVVQNQLYRKKSFDRLSYICYFSQHEVMEGDEITLVEEVVNNKLLPLPWLKAELNTSRYLDFAGSQSTLAEDSRFVPSFFMMKSHHRVTRNWKVKCTKRGVYTLQKVVLVSTDLFGNVNTSKLIEVNQTVTVLPRPVDVLDAPIFPRHLSGDHVVRRQVIADPFMIAGVREYTDRDPMNKIHWLASSHHNELMVHNNEYTASQSLSILLNVQSRSYEQGPTMEVNKIEEAIRVCAGYLDDTLRTGIPVQLYVNAAIDESDTPVITNAYWGNEHILDLLRMLAALHLKSTDQFKFFLHDECRSIKTSDIVIITAFLSEPIYDYALEMQQNGADVKIVFMGKIAEDFHVPAELAVFEYTGEMSEK